MADRNQCDFFLTESAFIKRDFNEANRIAMTRDDFDEKSTYGGPIFQRRARF